MEVENCKVPVCAGPGTPEIDPPRLSDAPDRLPNTSNATDNERALLSSLHSSMSPFFLVAANWLSRL